LLAVIIRADFEADGIVFATPIELPQQLGFMKRPEGYEIDPHVHVLKRYEVEYSSETLFIRKGKVRIDFYSEEKQYLSSEILTAGDVVLLSRGGHGFEMLEESEIIEVKQGPYESDNDKIRFEGVEKNQIIL
jgi:mannose-6-phosphate isomerase-like protein (cupin superfamily)